MSVVGVDIDEVLAEYAAGFFKFHNEKYGTNIDVSRLASYRFGQAIGTTEEEIVQKMAEFHSTREFKELALVPGAKESIMQLENELIAITVRSPLIQQQTQEWLDTHFKGKIKNIHFARNIHVGEKNRKTKADFCREAGVQVMIEDSLETANDCARNEIPTILLDKPWNQGPLPPLITRVYSWSEIPAAIKTILK